MLLISQWASKAVCGTVGGLYAAQLRRFPPLVRIETTNACNARCTICPHHRLQRPIRRMDDGLYRQIIDECAAGGCKQVHLHNFGEPLLDKSLEDRVRYAKQRGIRKVKIFSNGSLLDAVRAEGLIAAGLDEIKISFDGATRAEFESIRRPLKFDVVVENVHRLVELRNRHQSPMQIHIACCSTSDKQGTMQMLEQSVDGFSFGKIHNWAIDDGGTSAAADDSPAGDSGKARLRKPCSRLWRTLTVLAGGEVALCCLDYDGQFLLGQIDAETTLTDIWQGAAYRRVRRLHLASQQHEIGLCRGCTKAFL